MTHEKIVKAFFMTSGKYSDEAKDFAKANRITLIDGEMFLMMIKRLPEPARDTLLAFATAGDYRTPSCHAVWGKDAGREGPGRKGGLLGLPALSGVQAEFGGAGGGVGRPGLFCLHSATCMLKALNCSECLHGLHDHTPVDLDIGVDVLDGRLRGCARRRADRPYR